MKKIILTLTILIAIVFIGTTVLAAENTNPTVTPTATTSLGTVAEGGDLSVTLKATNITFELGISTVTASIEYNENVFEPLGDTSFDNLNGWVASYDQLAKVVTLTRGMGEQLQKQDGDLVKIDFKVKTGATGEVTSIKFNDMKFGDGASAEFTAEPISTSDITIGTGTIAPIQPDPTPIPTPTPTPTPTPDPVTPDPQPGKDQPDDIPETGLTDTMGYIILALGIAAVIFYVNYKKLERKNIRYVDVK